MASSKQVSKKKVPNPTGKGGFQERPQDRNSGHWDSKLVFSYQYRRFMNMSLDEWNDFRMVSNADKTVVEELAFRAVERAKNSLPDIREITDRTEGKATQLIDVTSAGEPIKTTLVEFVGEVGQPSKPKPKR